MLLRIALAVGLVCALAFAVTREPVDDSTPEACVRSFIAALNAKDLGTASSLVVGGKTGNPLFSGLILEHFEVKSIKLLKAEDGDLVISASLVATRPQSQASGAENSNVPSPMSDLFHLVNKDGHWRIDPLSTDLFRGSVPPSIVADLLAADIPNRSPGQVPGSPATVCLSNSKQLGLGTIMYQNDYDDVLPPADHWKSYIYPYVKNATVFHCPDDKEAGNVSYRMSEKVSRANSSAFVAPTETVEVYEGTGGYLVARHTGRGSVAYADGHAKLVDPATFKKGYHGPQMAEKR